jgi:hypothetical protein
MLLPLACLALPALPACQLPSCCGGCGCCWLAAAGCWLLLAGCGWLRLAAAIA